MLHKWERSLRSWNPRILVCQSPDVNAFFLRGLATKGTKNLAPEHPYLWREDTSQAGTQQEWEVGDPRSSSLLQAAWG